LAGVPPQTPLGELTAFPEIPYLRCPTSKGEGKGEGKGRREAVGKGRGRKWKKR